MKNFFSNLTKKYGQYLLIGLSLFVLSIALMGRAGVLAELLSQGPKVAFAAPCGLNEGCTKICNPGEANVASRACVDANSCTYSVQVCNADGTGFDTQNETNCELARSINCVPSGPSKVCNPGEANVATRSCVDANSCTYSVQVCNGDGSGFDSRNETNCNLAPAGCRPSTPTQVCNPNEANVSTRSCVDANSCTYSVQVCNGNGTGFESRNETNCDLAPSGCHPSTPNQICTPGQRDANSRACIGSTGCNYNLNECNSDGMGWHQVQETNCSLAPSGCNGMCTANDQTGVITQCDGNQMCKHNQWIGTMCNTGIGGAYDCRPANPGECGVVNPTSCFVCDNGAYRSTSTDNCNSTTATCNPSNPGQGACTGATVGQSCGTTNVACLVCDNHLWRADGNGCAANSPVCDPNNSATWGGCLPGNQSAGGACDRQIVTSPSPSVCVSNGSCSATTPACGTTTQGVDNCTNVCFKRGQACPSVTPTPGVTPSPTPSSNPAVCGPNTTQSIGQNGAIVCIGITNTVTNTVTNNNTNNNSQSQSVSVVAQGGSVNMPAAARAAYQRAYVKTAGVPMKTGQVEVAGVQELPKTGLPLVAWMLVGVAPFGAKLRRFGRSSVEETTANSMWEDRQFKKS